MSLPRSPYSKTAMASAASEAYRKCSAELIKAIQDPLSLAWELVAAGIVSRSVVDVMNVMGLPPLEQKTKLLSAVGDQIDVDPAKLQNFLQALRKQTFKEVADKLESIYKNCGMS